MNSSIQFLLDKARAGNKSAVNKLMECKRNDLRQLVRSRLDRKIRRRIDISDVIQEILFLASRRLQKYLSKPEIPFGQWLRRIARDRIIDAYRQHNGAGRRSVDREQQIGHQDDSKNLFLQQLPESQLTPTTFAMKKELEQRVKLALTSLNPSDSDIIVMRHYQFLSNREVAERLNLTTATASVRYVRALHRLRGAMGSDVLDAWQG